MQDAVAACGEIITDASRRAEGAVGDEKYICELVDGQFADGVVVCRRSVGGARFVFQCAAIIYSEFYRALTQNITVVFADYFVP